MEPSVAVYFAVIHRVIFTEIESNVASTDVSFPSPEDTQYIRFIRTVILILFLYNIVIVL